ncbi:receptor-type tyrosine-protein phosphatase eta-like [Polymixia lowei]
MIGPLSVSKTTSSITLNWTKPAGEVFKYEVDWHNGGTVITKTTSNTFAVLPDLIAGTNYTVRVFAIAQDNQTKGDPRIISSTTKPEVVRNVMVTEVTTSSVSLTWTEPEGNVTSYTVEWTELGAAVRNISTNETSTSILGLLAGFQYNITVAAVSGHLNEGARTPVTTFTKPEKPGDIKVTTRGTNFLNINFTLPGGKVDRYVVNISNEELAIQHSNTTDVTTASLSALYPGRIYVITVTAVAGNFSSTSDQVSLATVPTHPGPIMIKQMTINSLHLEWETPALMESAPGISYNISYQSEGGQVQHQPSTANSTVLSSLSSGTSYTVTVETVGPQNLRSEVVHKSIYTLPNPVINLIASPESTTSVKVEWSNPQGVQAHYMYRVQTSNTSGTLVNTTTVSVNSLVVTGLEPGTRYNFTVTTVAAPGSDSTVEQAFSYTMPKAVTNLAVDELNTTALRLTWVRQDDYKPTYSYRVIVSKNNEVFRNASTDTETYTVTDLTPGKSYTFRVFTVVEAVKSAMESTSSHTRPGAVSDIVAIGTTTIMSVSWTAAEGQVDFYSVLLYRDGLLKRNQSGLVNTTLIVLFENLEPGTIYSVVVLTQSGPLSDSVTADNATFPNPPGPVTVESQTTDSINISWALPEDMEPNQYNFTVFYLDQVNETSNNWILLENFRSGTRYTISVVTVAALSYRSTEVITQNYTRPQPVSMLRQAGISPTYVTLQWDQPDHKPGYSYLVEVTNRSSSEVVFNTTHTVHALQSGSNYSFTVTTQTEDGTRATPRTVSYFTRPYNISGLRATTLNTTAVRLNWTQPLQYKNGYRYRIETSGCGSRNTTVEDEEAEISGLTPGTNCTFCVLVRAEDGTEGEPRCASQYTKPELVLHAVYNSGSNSTILVSWSAPLGNVERYVIDLNSSSQAFPPVVLNSTSRSFLFDHLSAGREYAAMVTTISGPFNASSRLITNATFPNPPGPIGILKKTTSSIQIQWQEAPLMANALFHYLVTYTQSQSAESTVNTSNTTHMFSNLSSGTPYNISVATVGPLGFKSKEVWSRLVTTRPKSVTSLDALTAVETITLKWNRPDDYQTSYRYFLTWGSSNGSISNNETTQKNELIISKLVPGSSYNFSVTTETFDGTQAAPLSISNCTNASPVLNLNCDSPNGTDAKVILSWTKPKGLNSGFRVTVQQPTQTTTDLINTCNPNCDHTVSKLNYFTEYTLIVETQSCGKPSTPESLMCTTGITSPPIPQNYEDLVTVAKKEHDLFSIEIELGLLDATNGPVTHFGVLVTDNINTVIGGAVGASLGVLCVLLVLVVVAVVYWKRQTKKESDIQIHSMSFRAKVNLAVRVEDYEAYYRKQKADSNCGFAEEFEDLKPVGTAQAKASALALDNKPKNRYNNVLPYDSSRVKLSIHGSPFDDYINANYIPGYNSRKEFIAAQGPLPCTVSEFWRMIWEKNVQTLVMLTRCNEQGRVKCEKYWPSETMHFGNITVTTTSEIPLEDWTIRDFDIKNVKTAETRTVRHFHFTAWPDHGVPESTELLINFRHLVREHMDQYSRHSPTVVHCSAGVGRTGTLIAIDRLIFQIERDSIVDVYGIIHDLRMHRPLMVQTEDQYVFLNQCAMDIIRSRTGTNVDLIYQNTAALTIYENVEPRKGSPKNGYHNA